MISICCFLVKAETLELIGISPGDREVLAPTLVDVAADSPRIAAAFGAITGLVGLIWSLWRYLGFA